MAKYLYEVTYAVDGVRGLLKESASGRKAAIESAIQAIGGKVEAFYYAFGPNDAVLIVDLPDNSTAASISITVAASGMARVRTTPLLTIEETDHALQGKLAYRPPGAAK